MNRLGLPSTIVRGWGPIRWLMVPALVCTVVQVGGCAAPVPQEASQAQAEPAVPAVQTAYGIRIEGLRLTSAGSMLDFRYRVLDPAKAAPLLNGKIQPYLFDEARGAKLGVPDTPVLGRIRQTARNHNIMGNRTYFVMFGNPGKAVRSGDRVSLLLGNVKITDLTVQ